MVLLDRPSGILHKPQALNPTPQPLNPAPQVLHPKPYTPNPQPEVSSPPRRDQSSSGFLPTGELGHDRAEDQPGPDLKRFFLLGCM